MKTLGILVSFLISIPACLATTIAWSGTELACDSQMTRGHSKLWTSHKIRRSDKRQATIAAAGDVYLIKKVMDQFMNTDQPMEDVKLKRLDPASGFQALIIYDNGKALFYDDDMENPIEIEAPFSFGSGADFALAALTEGKTAEQAIDLAKQLDIFTGGGVRVFKAPQLEAPKPGN